MSSSESTLVSRTIQQQRRIYDETVKVTKQIRRIRALRIQTRTPKTFQKLVGWGVRNPLPWALVQTINGMIAKNAPQFDRLPLNMDDPAEREVAAYLASSAWPLIQSYGRIHKVDYFYKACDQLTGDGIGIFKMRRQYLKGYPESPGENPTDQEWSEYNAKVADFMANPRSPNPFAITQIDSATFFPDRAEEPEYVVEYGYKPLAASLAALNLRATRDGKIVPYSQDEQASVLMNNDFPRGGMFSEEMQPSGMGNNVVMAEVWTPDYCYIEVGGNYFKYENEFGEIPYIWRYGMTTSIPDPALERVSTVFPFFALDPYINTVLTGLLAWGIMASMPVAVITTPPTPGNIGNSDQANVDIPLGQMMRLAPGQDFDYKVPPNMGTEAVNVLNLMLSFYDRAGVTSMARGNIGTRTPGSTFTAALEAAADMVGPIKTGLAGILTDIVQMTWRAVTNFNIPLNITGYSISQTGLKGDRTRFHITPQMINDYYDLSCELQAFSEQELMARGQYAALMVDKQLWSWERGAKHAGVQNPEAERKQIILDTVRKSPEYMQLIISGALADDPVLAQAAAVSGGAAGMPPGQPEMGTGDRHREGMMSPMSGGGRAVSAPRNPTGPGNGVAPSIPQER
jgi:hypothetical protein